VDLTIIEASRNTSEQVTVPESVATERIIGRLTQVWRLPVTDRDGRALSYRLEDARSRRPIHPSSTLADAGVGENDVLRLVANPTDAPSPAGYEAPVPSAESRPFADAPSATPTPGDWGAPEPSRARRGVSVPVWLALVGLLACVAVGVAFATGTFSGGRKHPVLAAPLSASIPQESPVQRDAPSGSEQASDREGIMSLLDSYQQTYSNHDVQGLEKLFAQDVRRHGLTKGGCMISRGLSPVLASYRSQFEAGSGHYRLVGLSERRIQIDSATQAHLQGHYTITPGGSGYVDFKFTDSGGAWKISEVNATCH